MKKKREPPSRPEWLRCPRCGSGWLYYRLETDTHRCRVCGAELKAYWSARRVRLVTPKEV